MSKPTFDRQSVRDFWQNESASLSALLQTYETFEDWVLDTSGSMVEKELLTLGNIHEFDQYSSEKLLQSVTMQEQSDLLASMCMGRALRLQRIFNDAKSDWLSEFVSFCEANRTEAEENVNYTRILLLAQFMFLGSIFSPARMNLINDIAAEVLDD